MAMTRFVHQDRQRGWIIRGLAIQSAGLSIALSLAFFLSKPERISAQAYTGLVATGGTVVWGVIFLFCGAIVVGASWRTLNALRTALAVASLGYFCMGVSFAYAAIHFPTANLTAPVVYFWLAYAHWFAIFLITYKLNHPRGQ